MLFLAAVASAVLPALPNGDRISLVEPGWSAGYGTGGRVWASAGALCRYLTRSDKCRGQRVVELGCGTGAVGIFVAKGLGPESVTLTDEKESLLTIARENASLNGAEVSLRRLKWGREPLDLEASLVVGSDVTYFREVQDDLCRTIGEMATEGAECVLAHQHRRLASFLSGRGQLESFVEACRVHSLQVKTLHVDKSNPASHVEILSVSRLRESR